jgi:photoactive yellow protein
MDSSAAMAAFRFDDPALAQGLADCTDADLDEFNFGVIGFDHTGIVQRYNRYESTNAGLPRDEVIGSDLFTSVAICMNNYLVAQRFEDALAQGAALDTTIDYVLTFRMRPTRVRLRLLAQPGAPLRYILIMRAV